MIKANTKLISSRFLILPLLLLPLTASETSAQIKKSKESAGMTKVADAYNFQRRLQRGLETFESVARNWAKQSNDPDVRADKDALAISYGSEGLMEMELGKYFRADSLLSKSMPLFKLKNSKAYFILMHSKLQMKMGQYGAALQTFDTIIQRFDSLPLLESMRYYAESGYAVYAYAIDAAYNAAKLGASVPEFTVKSAALLKRTYDAHPLDALGLMALEGLAYINKDPRENYSIKIDILCSTKPKLLEAKKVFERQLNGANEEKNGASSK